jgi:hypothetical protein
MGRAFFPVPCPIHPIAWKVNSAKFVGTEFSEVQRSPVPPQALSRSLPHAEQKCPFGYEK